MRVHTKGCFRAEALGPWGGLVVNPTVGYAVGSIDRYAPEVSLDVIERLADAFAELRLLVEQGVLAYPYSTRELVNITRHLQVRTRTASHRCCCAR